MRYCGADESPSMSRSPAAVRDCRALLAPFRWPASRCGSGQFVVEVAAAPPGWLSVSLAPVEQVPAVRQFVSLVPRTASAVRPFRPLARPIAPVVARARPGPADADANLLGSAGPLEIVWRAPRP